MKRGCRIRDELFSVFAIANNLSHGRIGLAVSKKVALRAVDRNRIKRHVRESFRSHQENLAGLDVVVMANPAAKLSAPPALRDSLNQHWERIIRQCRKS